MTPGLRKLALTAHVASSVGWLGAVAAFLPLAVAALTSQHAETVRAAYLAMEIIARFVMIPLSFASLLTGFVQALGTTWGLFRHYWVLIKLVITVLATIILLKYTQNLSDLARVAAGPTLSGADLGVLRVPMHLLHAGLALLALLVNTTLSIYKPRGLTRYGRRQQHEQRGAGVDGGTL